VRRAAVLTLLAACSSGPEATVRERRVLDALADDNYMWSLREPELVAMKLRKMQRGPYEWLRGTAPLFWRDLMEPGVARYETSFGDPLSSRVLLVGDPHCENIGTFRAADGEQLVDWNDFDATGYGPFTGDVRRLGAGLSIVAALGGDEAFASELVAAALTAYADEIAAASPVVVGVGVHEYFDDELEKARERGETLYAIDEVAPVMAGERVLALGDLEPVADDGLLEDRLLEVDRAVADMLDRAVAQWDPRARVKLRARRIGSGVASYPAWRFNVVLEGPTDSPDDDRMIELKETREGTINRGVPQREAAEWGSPAIRAVDTQRRLQARPDADALLGSAQVGGLVLKIRDREAFQRGVDAEDLVELVEDDRPQLLAIATTYGRLLARAHGRARTADDLLGAAVIAPLLAGRTVEWVTELSAAIADDTALIIADHASMADRDLAAEVMP